MKYSELKTQEAEALQGMLRAERKRLEQLRFQVHEGTSKDVRELRQAKLQIARILTALSQREQIKSAATAVSKVTAAGGADRAQASGGKK